MQSLEALAEIQGSMVRLILRKLSELSQNFIYFFSSSLRCDDRNRLKRVTDAEII